MANRIKFTRPVSRKAGRWPGIRIAFPGDEQRLYFFLRVMGHDLGKRVDGRPWSGTRMARECLRYVASLYSDSEENRAFLGSALRTVEQQSWLMPAEGPKGQKKPQTPKK